MNQGTVTDTSDGDAAGPAGKFLRVSDRLAAIVAVTFALAAGAYILWYAIRVVQSDIAEIRGQEPLVVSGVMKVMSGQPLYTDLNKPPFDVIQYTPLYHYVLAAAAALKGYEPGQVLEVTRLGRFLSSCLSLAQVAILFGILRYVLRIRLPLAVVATAAVWLVHAPWDFMARGDVIASLCFIAAIGLTCHALQRSRDVALAESFIAAASFLGYVAFMAKQNGAQICVVLLLFFVLRREWRRAAVVVLASVLPLALTLWAGPVVFGGHFFDHVVGGLNNGVRIHGAFVSSYLPVFLNYNMAVVSALGAFIACSWFGRWTDPARQFLALALVVTFALATLSSLKLGAAANYYNDFMTLAFLCLAHWLEGVSTDSPVSARPIRWAVTVFAVLFFTNTAVAFREEYDHSRWVHLSDYGGAVRYLEKELTAHPGKQFFTIDYTLANYFPGRAVVPQYALSAIVHARGLVDYREAEAMMRVGAVRWLLLGNGQNPARQLGFVGIDPGPFVHERQLDGFSVWIHSDDSGS